MVAIVPDQIVRRREDRSLSGEGVEAPETLEAAEAVVVRCEDEPVLDGERGRAVLGRAVEPGRAAVELVGSAVFVLPSTSGRQATYRSNAIAAAARELARWLASPEGGEP